MAQISNVPNSATISLLRGSTLVFTLTFTNADGSPLDISSNTVSLEVLNQAGTAVLTITSGAGITIGSNVATVTISAAQTGALAVGSYSYRVFRTASGVVTPALSGEFNVRLVAA